MLVVLFACRGESTLDDSSTTLPSEAGSSVATVLEAAACVDPAARAASPFDTVLVGEHWEGAMLEPYRGARGITVADFDGNGSLDLFVPEADRASHLLLGDGTSFAEANERLGGEIRDVVGATAADYDGDGDQDLTLYHERSDPAVLVNDGAANFEYVALKVEGEDTGCAGSASYGDMDLDGDLDLFVGRRDFVLQQLGCASWLFENMGDGVFDLVRTDLPDEAMASAWLPLDGDPEPELYVGGNRGSETGNRVFDNVGGTLTPMVVGMERVMDTMGIGIGDINHDGRIDVVVPGWEEIPVFESTGNELWVDVSFARGITPDLTAQQFVAWGGEVVDLDNDGLEDIIVTFGMTEAPNEPYVLVEQPDEIYRQEEPDVWTRVGAAWGYDHLDPHIGLLAVDLDRNGFVDTIRRRPGGFLRVDLARCDASAWLQVRLWQPGANPDALGAVVAVEDGDERWTRLVQQGGNSYRVGGPPEVHFGLGNRDRVDALVVTWPDGEVERFRNLPTRGFVEVVRAGEP